MANQIVKLIVAAGLAGFAGALPAQADTVAWSLTGVGNGDSGSGTLTETGGTITGITGTVTVDTLGTFTITGLEAPGGYGSNDNAFTGTTTAPAFLSGSGVTFDGVSGGTTVAFNISSFGFGPPDYYLLNSSQNPDGFVFFGSTGFGSDGVAFTAAVPEASTWAMMLLGFAALGFAAYRRGRAGAAAATA